MNRRTILALAVSSAIALAATAPGALAAPPMESEPTLSLADFKGLPAAKGPGYRIENKVPVYGYLGQFKIVTDDGTFVADGVEMLRIRVAEAPALAKLAQVSQSDVFVDALGKSAVSTGKAVTKAVTHPVDTISGIPQGVGRFFSSAGKTVQRTASGAGSGSSSSATKDAVGVNKAKRTIAQPLGIDPYTTHPHLAKRLDDLAWATVAGGATLNVAMFAVSAGAVTAISTTASVSKLAWDLPPEDIRARNEKSLLALGVKQGTANTLLGNAWYTPTLALEYAAALGAFAPSAGADDFTLLASAAASETEARFYVNQLKLADAHAGAAKGGKIERRGLVGVVRTGDTVFAPIPLDYLIHDKHVAQFVNRLDDGIRDKQIWLTGTASPAVKEAMAANGWTLRENVPLK